VKGILVMTTTHLAYDLDNMPRKTRAERATQPATSTVAEKSAALLAIAQSRRRIELERRRIVQEAGIARRAGASWVELGEVLGISRQAARQRFEGN
jgi:lipase chaperone LimK